MSRLIVYLPALVLAAWSLLAALDFAENTVWLALMTVATTVTVRELRGRYRP